MNSSLLVEGEEYLIRYLNILGVYTGRNWVDGDGEIMYELKYCTDTKDILGIFKEEELMIS